ncbi:MAG: glycine--tRNA ligase subunit beta [Elusimicrobiota bacterium]|jgi:glycyl-tRNA synthetase beta chain|nr:glycine--tRNA ligase subunit beta [Elusimicrobiota bacterium]
MKNKILQNQDLLLETYIEEIPASYIEPALKQMSDFAIRAFESYGVIFGEIKTYATPRRLVLSIENIEPKSQDKTIEISGPPLKAAKDENGNWTQAAVGFAAKNEVEPQDLSIKETPKGQYLFFCKTVKGENTKKLLAQILPQLIKNINFPKTMIWEDSAFKFARPIRSVLALYGQDIIRFKIADITSSNYSFGLHTTDNKKISLKNPQEYASKLKNRMVLVNQDERKEAMRKSIKAAVSQIGSIIEDEELMDEVNYLVEYPTAVLCKFDETYLELPQEVLTVCMKKSQKCFAVKDKKGVFTNYFIGVKNGTSQYLDIVRAGYEKVVAARLADAKFFFKNDLENGLDANIEKLKGIVFNKEIGAIYEKSERAAQIAAFVNTNFNFAVSSKDLQRAALLSKADLASEMVFEYPQLQGIIGKIYALKLKEKDDIANAIQEHYMPLSAGGELPTNKIAILISIADKIDTLCADFCIGLEPTGSADPYGLRRAAIGLIRMFVRDFPDKNLGKIIDYAFEILPQKVKDNPSFENAKDKLIVFLWQRIENMLETDGYENSDIKAVINAAKLMKLNFLGSIKPKLEALKDAKQKNDFSKISESFKRINNIMIQAKKQNNEISDFIDTAILQDAAEKALFEKSKDISLEIKMMIDNAQFSGVFEKVLQLKPYIDDFFEKVMVMAEDEALKKNRIALLKFIKDIFSNFIDFSAVY